MNTRLRRPPGRPVSASYIIDETVREMRINPSDLLGKSRHFRVCIARGLATIIMRELTVLSFPDIAERLHRSNHSTVVTAADRVRRQIESEIPIGPEEDSVRVDLAYQRIGAAVLARHRKEEAAGKVDNLKNKNFAGAIVQ